MLFVALLLLSVISNSLVQGSMMVRRAGVGETVTMECPHAPEWKKVVWCKADIPKYCNRIVDTVAQKDNGRTSIKRRSGSVIVIIKTLVKSDSGIYLSGYSDVQQYIHHPDIVMLKVTSAGSWTADNTTVKGVMQSATNLHCHYKQQFKSNEKFLCKVTSVNSCSVIAGYAYSTEHGSRNLTITVNNSTDFAVTIKQTNEGDQGEYWCGATVADNFEIVQIKTLEISKAMIKTPEVSDDSKRNDELIVQILWTLTRWILLGTLFLCTVSIHCMTAFQRQAGTKQNPQHRQIGPSAGSQPEMSMASFHTTNAAQATVCLH